jgi:hypothetical protein
LEEKMGPWLFRVYGVMVKEYDGISDPEKVVFDSIDIWLQIQKIPDLYRKEFLVDQMAAKLGTVRKIVLNTSGNFIRVCVTLKINAPLKRFASLNIQGNERLVYQIKYEKIPCFCAACGLMGHSDMECGTGENLPASKKWGDWLKTEKEWNYQASDPDRRTD